MRVLLLLTVFTLLTGCGHKTDLKLPESGIAKINQSLPE